MREPEIIPIFGANGRLDAAVMQTERGDLLLATDLDEQGNLLPYVAIRRPDGSVETLSL